MRWLLFATWLSWSSTPTLERRNRNFKDDGIKFTFRTESKIPLQNPAPVVKLIQSLAVGISHHKSMVSFTVTTPGKPKLDLEFAAKSPDQITVNDLKTAIQAKLPKVSLALVYNHETACWNSYRSSFLIDNVSRSLL